MDKAITASLLIIASVVASLALINAVIPAMNRSSGALTAANTAAAERIKTDVQVAHVVGNSTTDQVTVWVKNVGSTKIRPIDATDVFLTTPTEVKRLPYGAASGPEYWEYEIENGTEWTQTVTVKFTLHLTDVSSGVYNITIGVYNSVSASKDFSV